MYKKKIIREHTKHTQCEESGWRQLIASRVNVCCLVSLIGSTWLWCLLLYTYKLFFHFIYIFSHKHMNSFTFEWFFYFLLFFCLSSSLAHSKHRLIVFLARALYSLTHSLNSFTHSTHSLTHLLTHLFKSNSHTWAELSLFTLRNFFYLFISNINIRLAFFGNYHGIFFCGTYQRSHIVFGELTNFVYVPF